MMIDKVVAVTLPFDWDILTINLRPIGHTCHRIQRARISRDAASYDLFCRCTIEYNINTKKNDDTQQTASQRYTHAHRQTDKHICLFHCRSCISTAVDSIVFILLFFHFVYNFCLLYYHFGVHSPSRSLTSRNVLRPLSHTIVYSCTVVWRCRCRMSTHTHTDTLVRWRSDCFVCYRLPFGCFVSCRRCNRSSVSYGISKHVNVCLLCPSAHIYLSIECFSCECVFVCILYILCATARNYNIYFMSFAK